MTAAVTLADHARTGLRNPPAPIPTAEGLSRRQACELVRIRWRYGRIGWAVRLDGSVGVWSLGPEGAAFPPIVLSRAGRIIG